MTHCVPPPGVRDLLPSVAFLFLLFMLSPVAVVAADGPVGRVIVANGDVTAVRAGESARSLDRGAPVYEGDEVRTGLRATAQLRFSDGGLFALQADTRFAVDTYEVNDDGGGSALMRFLRGALRTITGSIGQRADDTYRLDTPTATIGVRGTAYALHYCDVECADSHGGEPGLYGRVGDGEVLVTTSGGNARFRAGMYFFVPEGGPPRTILKPPEGILDGTGADDGDDAETAEHDSETTITALEETSSLESEGVGDTSEPIFEASDTFIASDEGTVTNISGAAITASTSTQNGLEFFPEGGAFNTDGSGNVDEVQFTNGPLVQLSGSSTLQESGSVQGLGVQWGRWEDGLLVDGGAPVAGNLAFATTSNFTDPTTLASLSGSFNYSNPVGPSAFDTTNLLWTVDALSVGVDFGAGDLVLNQFDLSPVSGIGMSFVDGDVFGEDLQVNNNSIEIRAMNGVGDFAEIRGQFVGAAAEGMIVILFADQNNGPEVTGTQVLQSP